MRDNWRPKIEWALDQIRERSQTTTTGCSDSELRELERKQGRALPAAYLGFLRAVGGNAGEFLRGSDFLFAQLDDLQTGAQALLNDDGGPTLPANAFVFCGHQGYQFLFFTVDDCPDPPIQYYLEGTRSFRTVTACFSDWLTDTVKEEFPGPER